MNKKVMALAVAGALTAPAAALAQVQIGGGLTMLYYSHDPDNKAVASKGDIMDSSESELYVRGEEKLGGGTSAWFQCATSIDGIFNGNSATVAGWCTRNSALGFRGGFGNAFVGNWDTPTKLVQNRIRGWFSGTNALVGGGFTLLGGGSASGVVNSAQTQTAIVSCVGAGCPATGATAQIATANAGGTAAGYSFYRRQANSVNYWSPNFGGFSVAAAFSTNNESTGIPDATSLTPRLWGINGVYAAGPLWVGLAYEKHDDYNPGVTTTIGAGASQYNGGSDNNITIGAGYTFARVFNIRAAYSKSEYEPTNAGSLEVKGYALYADWNVAGPHTIRAAFITVDDTEGNTSQNVGPYRNPVGNTSNTGADVTTLAYSYDISKRTQTFFAYNQLKNDSLATFNMGKVAAVAGGKQKSIGIGLKHSF